MALTRSFNDLVQRQIAEDPRHAAALLRNDIKAALAGCKEQLINDELR